MDAAALNHVAGRAVCGVAVEGDPRQRRIRQVRHGGTHNLSSRLNWISSN